jgi:N-acetylmuramic acid 6-phosphate etherase
MGTEQTDARYRDLETWGDIEILSALHDGHVAAAAAVGPALPSIAAAAHEAVPRLTHGGRLLYIGAGTSGRIGVQDGAELGPTFGWPSEQTMFLMAGGERALVAPVEGAEDSAADAVARVEEIGVGRNDIALGITASGATPFTVSAIEAAHARGAMTIGMANNAGSPLLQICDHPILLDTGPEPISGSTRLNAGTAQKIALNLFSTLVMIRLGRVYGGMMVSMRATNEKLRRRAVQMVAAIAGVENQAASSAFSEAGGDVKLAVLIARGLSHQEATSMLAKHEGNLRRVLGEAGDG